MKTLKLISAWGALMMALTLYLHAGSIQTVPPYDNSSYAIPVGPGADGTANVIFKVTSTDPTVTVSGTFTNATNPSPSFAQSGSLYSATANYPASRAGTSNPVTITITTSDAGGTCTASIWKSHSISPSRYSLADFQLSSNYLVDVIRNIAWPTMGQFVASLEGATGANPAPTQRINFKVIVLSSRQSLRVNNN